MYQYYGIRHHGPGSARALRKALERDPPDCLLIELPADAAPLLPYLGRPEGEKALDPPVAMLLYEEKNPGTAVFLPFTRFSPEWNAIRMAQARNIPIRCMDLPMGMYFPVQAQERARREASLFAASEGSEAVESEALRQDPLGRMAALAGYTDAERWWEVTFEHADSDGDVFPIVAEMMTALREGVEASAETLLREAHMRQVLRKAAKEGFRRMAVVCGAWHLPALADHRSVKAGQDQALLRGLRKTRVVATWIPWSYDRMTFRSGLRSGVHAPAWYELLFDHRAGATAHWMAGAARQLREEDLASSPAGVTEAVRLADTLAALRGLQVPGVEELQEAAVAVLCAGDPALLARVAEHLVVGHRVGSVPDDIPSVPLQQDVLQQVRTARLTPYWERTTSEWLGATAANPLGGIDLREPAGKLKSRLLHRLSVIGVPWGVPMDPERHATAGTFREYWKLRWSADFTFRLIERSGWGNTLEEAAVYKLQKDSEEAGQLPALSRLLDQALKADLAAAYPMLLERLAAMAAVAGDTFQLMDALPTLVEILLYGNVRETPEAPVAELVDQLVTRICIGLAGALVHLDEEASRVAAEKVRAVQAALGLLRKEEHLSVWFAALRRLPENRAVHPLLEGVCDRLLFDQGIHPAGGMADRMAFALSAGRPVQESAAWLEGFLSGSGLVLVHHAELWRLLDGWVCALRQEEFLPLLPVLRRTFARFSGAERSRMMELARQSFGSGSPAAGAASARLDGRRTGKVSPLLVRLLEG